MKTIKGKFEISATPLEPDDAVKRIGATRTMFEKRLSGPLDANSVVSMLGLMDRKLGSGGYVALERVEGILDGRRGSFCLQHSSFMTRGKPEQTITVVPDSGTDELAGLSGTMTIDIVNGEHFYTFAYLLP